MWPHLKNFSLTKMKLFFRDIFSIKNFAKKFNSGSFGSCLFAVKFFTIFFFSDLRMLVGFLECFHLLSLIYDLDIFWFCIFLLSSTLKKVLEHFSPSSSDLMLARSLAPFTCLFSNWWSSSCKFFIIGLISGLKFCFLYRFRNLFFSLEILIISWVVELLENVLVFSLKQDLMYFHLSLAEEWLLFCVFSKEIKFFSAEEKSG